MTPLKLIPLLAVFLLESRCTSGNKPPPVDAPSPGESDPGDDPGPTPMPPPTDTPPGDGATPYITGCSNFFAARVAEMMRDNDPSFAASCETPLTAPEDAGIALCIKGESANACASRLYDTPPALEGDCEQAEGCMRAQWLPSCMDGTDNCGAREVICQDGTRPLAYAEPSTAGPSNEWLIDLTPDGGPCQGASCWVNYRFMRVINDAVIERAMSSMHPDYALPKATRKATGVVSGDPSRPFSAFNRVRLDRCSDAASDADEQVSFADGLLPNTPTKSSLEFRAATMSSTTVLHHRGFRQFVGLFHQLATSAGRDLDGDGAPDMPSISDASLIVLSAGSDATRWMILAGDALAETLAVIAPSAQVVLLLDGGFEPGLDTAGRYAAGAPADYNLFKDPFVSHGLCALPDNDDGIDNEACSDQSYRPGLGADGRPSDFDVLVTRGVRLDESCLAFHAADPTTCYDKGHTLLHHVSTPVLILADQEDNNKLDNNPQFSDVASYAWGTAELFRSTLLKQAYDVRAHWDEREEASAPRKPRQLLRKSRRAGSNASGGNHVMLGDDVKMRWKMTLCDGGTQTALTSPSAEETLATWAREIATGSTGGLTESFVVEDVERWNGTADYWVTGEDCSDHE